MAANQTVSAPLVLPIGHYAGAVREPGDAALRHEVRRGGELVAMPDDVFQVWGLSHGVPAAAEQRRWTRQALLDQATVMGLAGAGDTLDDLLREEFVIEVQPEGAAAREAARGFHMHPAMLGLGNTSQNAQTFSVGFVGAPVVEVSRTVFELWRWAPVEHSLWDLVRFFTENERTHGVADPERVDPDLVLSTLWEALPVLVSAGATYLDVAE